MGRLLRSLDDSEESAAVHEREQHLMHYILAAERICAHCFPYMMFMRG